VILVKKESVNFTLRMSAEQKLQLELIAHREGRNLTNLINRALQQYIDEYQRKK
jgi:predicted DNA-binding protein